MKFTTESGSDYELDTDNKRIRRLGNPVTQPTNRQGSDGEWKTYEALGFCGPRLLVLWDSEGRGTLTSSLRQSDVAAIMEANNG